MNGPKNGFLKQNKISCLLQCFGSIKIMEPNRIKIDKLQMNFESPQQNVIADFEAVKIEHEKF